jgi:hypothetical protein
VALEANIKKHPAYFHRFDALWTPTILILDSDGVERARIEGYLPKDEFHAALEMGLARVAFTQKKWPEAERRYAEVLTDHPASKSAPEALYWKGVSRYKATNDHTALDELPEQFKEKYPDSLWALKTVPWAAH